MVVFGERLMKGYETLMEIRYGVKETEVLQSHRNPNSSRGEVDELWLVVQQGGEVPLTVGDLVRMGRVEFKVRELGLRGAQHQAPPPAEAGTFYTE